MICLNSTFCPSVHCWPLNMPDLSKFLLRVKRKQKLPGPSSHGNLLDFQRITMLNSATELNVDNYFKWLLQIFFCVVGLGFVGFVCFGLFGFLFCFITWQDYVFLCSFSKTQGIPGFSGEANTTIHISVQKLSLTQRQISILNLYNTITISVLCMYKARAKFDPGILARRTAPGLIGVHRCLSSYLYSQAALPFFTSQCSNLLLSISKYTFCTPWSSFKILARGIFHLKCTSCMSSVPRKLKPGNLKGTTGRSKLKESCKIWKSK